ncbi:MAG TPA: hypothetical protein VIB38_13450, partial [Aestuariivirgaceae bacterium]
RSEVQILSPQPLQAIGFKGSIFGAQRWVLFYLFAICKVIYSKCEISSEGESDQPLANNQRQVSYADELDKYYQNCRIADAQSEQRKVTRRPCVVDTFYLQQNIDIQGDIGQQRE